MADNYNEIFAQRFKALRVNNGYTQQQFANLFNVTRSCICYWETGKRLPEHPKICDICAFFNVSSDYLLGFSDVSPSKVSESKTSYNADDYLDIRKLSSENKRQIKDFYKYLEEKQKRESFALENKNKK